MMRLKTLIVLAAFAATASGAAFAQSPPPGGMGGPPSPEMQAAREAMMKACATDAKTLCDGKEGREMMMCMRQNADKVSPPCQDAMSKMPRRGPPPPAPN